jgi:hypothetical protein
VSLSARSLLVACLSVVCVGVGGVGVAVAAAPEEPVTETATQVGANSATLNGVLNPGSLAVDGWYFALAKGGACMGEARVGGEGPAEVEARRESSVVDGLEPGTAYAFCLVAYDEGGEETVGAAQAFTTSVSQPVVDGEQAASVARSTATLEAFVDPEKQATSCLRFEYGETTAYGWSVPCVPGSLGDDFGDQTATASLTGLKPGATYHFRVVVENPSSPAGGTYGSDRSFATHAAIVGESYSGVSSRSAMLEAKLNVDGAPFSYHFEYGTTSAYGSSTPVASTGSAAEEAGVTAAVEDLTPSTEYHFRVVAEDSNGEVTRGIDMHFVSLPAGIEGLPDERVYEMVTPIEKEDAEVYAPLAVEPENQAEEYFTRRITEVESEGNRVVYEGDPTHSGEGESRGNGLGSAYLATRSAGGGWTQVSIQPPGRRVTFYRGFSQDMSIGVLDSITENPENEELQLPGSIAPPNECGDIFCTRQDLYRHLFDEESYQPLYTTLPKRSFRSGEFWGPTTDDGNQTEEPSFAGGTSDMNDLLFEANDALLSGEGGFIERELDSDVGQEIAEHKITKSNLKKENSPYLYVWDQGRLALVDVTPNGTVLPNATFGAPHAAGERTPGNPPDFSRVISGDGSRVFWTALEGEGAAAVPKALYVRENPGEPQSPVNGQRECLVAADACTIQLDDAVGGGARFWTASSDGDKVFFTKGGLYEYEMSSVPDKAGVLTDLTPGLEVKGVLGASEDASYVYYVDSNDQLYVLHDGSGGWEAPVPIAKLSPGDGEALPPIFGLDGFTTNEGGFAGDWVPGMGERTAEVTADGRGLVFVSTESIPVKGFPSGYANEGREEVYVYSATSNSLACPSCSQSGEPGSEGFIPVSWSNSHMPSLVSENGNRVFFDSGSALVPRDTNGKLDVYEWEREGTSSCQQGEGTDGGCVYLLSGGMSNEPSYLLGASASGSDVFIITRARLTSDAGDELFKLFDARVDGLNPPTSPACTGTGCQGVPEAPPTFATPSSVTYNGVGNFSPPPTTTTSSLRSKSKKAPTRVQKLAAALKACKKMKGKRRASCDARARSRYGSKGKAGRSGSTKRGSK